MSRRGIVIALASAGCLSSTSVLARDGAPLLVGSPSRGGVSLYDASGTPLGSIPSGFPAGARLSVGDLNQDALDETLVAAPSPPDVLGARGSVSVYTPFGDLSSRFGDSLMVTFTEGSAVASGDVTGDGADDIVVATPRDPQELFSRGTVSATPLKV